MSGLFNKIKLLWLRNSSAFMRLLTFNILFSISVWILSSLTSSSLYTFIAVPGSFVELINKPYTLLTYMFAHSTFGHLLMNMIILYFVASVFEDFMGRKRTYQVYLASGLVGAFIYVLFLPGNSAMVGASGAVMGILYGLTALRPNYQFYLYGIFKLRLWWVTVAYAAFDLLAILSSAQNLGGHICHIAGGLTGAILVIYWSGMLNKLKRPHILPRKNKQKNYVINADILDTRKGFNPPVRNIIPSQEEIDQILDKINESGYDNLSESEKEILFRAKDLEV